MLVEQRRHHTLQPTALVHEAYLRLQRLEGPMWQERKRFFAVAGKTMRSVLVDHARRRDAIKRGGGLDAQSTSFEQTPGESGSMLASISVLDLEAALIELEQVDPDLVKVVELLFFAGLTTAEAGEVLDVSERTVKRDWRTARAWLKVRLTSTDEV